VGAEVWADAAAIKAAMVRRDFRRTVVLLEKPTENDTGIGGPALAAEAEGDVAGRGSSLFAPEEFFQIRAFDSDLKFCTTRLADPDHASMHPLDAALQHDHIAGAKLMTGRMEAGAGRRNVERANVRGAPGGKKINFERHGYRKALILAQLAKQLQLQFRESVFG